MPHFISTTETQEINCQGDFKVAITFSHDVNTEGITVRVRTRNPDNLRHLSPTEASPLIAPGASRTVTFSGQLQNIDQRGEFFIRFDGRGATEVIDRDEVRIVIDPVPIEPFDRPDPVTAEPDGSFEYEVVVSCAGGGGNFGVDYETFAGGNVARLESDPDSPLALTCPGPNKVVTVTGLLANPAEAGIVRFNFTTGVCKCKVLTDIQPNPAPDEKAHAQALAQ